MLEMGILYEALCGSDSICKVSNPLAEGVMRPNTKVLHKVQVLITNKASIKVLGHLFKIFDFGNG